MPQLNIHKQELPDRVINFSGAQVLILGRAASCDIPLPDHNLRVSRYHAALVRRLGAAERYFVRDLGSIDGVRVSGKLIYQHTLDDGDVIDIGEYRLTYSDNVSELACSPRIRVISSKHADVDITGSTMSHSSQGLQHISVSEARREVIEQILHHGARSASLSELLENSLPLIVRSLDAFRGFAGIFNEHNCQSFREVGVTGFSGYEAIEIEDPHFCSRLAEGRVVKEETVLLTPILASKHPLGFLCIERSPFNSSFSQEEIEYLLMLGQLFAGRSSSAPLRDNEGVQEWGIDVISNGRRLSELWSQIRDAAITDDNVLLLGESGTGKEVLARAIARTSSYSCGPFIARNCAAIPSELVDIELFGYAPNSGIHGADPKGAPGCFENADGGVLFLDEIHGLNASMQDKLLRVLQERQVWRFGARKPISVKLKVLAATDQDVEQALASGALRKPLFYRFGKTISLPPLRERREEIPLLAFYFLDRYACRLGTKTRSISRRALRQLSAYDWPGNIRELENVIRSAVQKNVEVIVSWHLPDYLRHVDCADHAMGAEEEVEPITTEEQSGGFLTIRELEKEKVREALQATRGNITAAARLLGYGSRMTMLNKMKAFGIPRDYGDAGNGAP